ncbi:hypothetical protein KKE26_12895 [bacterium]|nr:hypothetical protein [bacterium]MBU1753336.1 hypothetical protein [bacterium]
MIKRGKQRDEEFSLADAEEKISRRGRGENLTRRRGERGGRGENLARRRGGGEENLA